MIAFFSLLGRLFAPAPRKPHRSILGMELLEDRTCPAGTWTWNGGLGLNLPWSNPGGGNWLHNGAATAAGQYPGMAGSNNDAVLFNNPGSGQATLDVAVGVLNALQFSGWGDTLTFNAARTLTVSAGSFVPADGSTVALGANGTLNLLDAANSVWTSGNITGGAQASVNVNGTTLQLSGTPGNLEANLNIGKSAASGQAGTVSLGGVASMTTNLTLTGAANSITINDGGTLWLGQTITAAGQQRLQGGLAFGAAHGAAAVAVTVNAGGTLDRTAPQSPAGVVNEVLIEGPVYNNGGLVEVRGTDVRLRIDGKDAANRSYWQQNAATAELFVQGANINAVGTFQIDVGKVRLQVVGGATTDMLDGAGLLFGNANATYLTVVDTAAGAVGTATIQGPVTLAANTTTTMNFKGATNASDVIDVRNGALTLNGTLKLIGSDGNTPTVGLDFLDDQGGVPAINGNFATITVQGILNPTVTTAIVNAGGVLRYRVTIT